LNKTKQLCKELRIKILETAFSAGSASAHIGGALSCVEIISTIFNKCNFDYHLSNKDKLILSKGHACLSLYGILNIFGYISDSELKTFEKDNSSYPGHPVINIEKGIHYSSGSLGNGLSFSCGLALSELIKKSDIKIFTILGDGECNEGIIWEALMFAKKYNLSNLYIFVDHNKFQQTGSNEEIMDMNNLEEKIASFGLKTFRVNGHDISALEECIDKGSSINKPKAIIADTVKGKGVSFIENNNEWHHKILSETLLNEAINEIKNA